LEGSDWVSIKTNEVFPEDEWIHVVALVDEGGYGAIYWNGELMISGQIQTPLPSKEITNNMVEALGEVMHISEE